MTGSILEQADVRGPEPQGADELRGRLHAMWAGVAGAWAEHAAYVDARGAELATRLLDVTQPQPGERVLELACGPGGLGLAAAERVAPDGEVVVSDVAAEMTAIAVARAAEKGVHNVTALELDLENIDQPDGSYDVVLCREGLMLVPDPARAATEIRRLLRPGGRAAVAVWAARDRNPWLGVVFDVATEQLGAPVPPPGIPHPFSLGDADRLAELLSGAGLTGVTVTEVPVPLRAASIDEWWTRTAALAGPLAQRLGSLPAPGAKALRDRAHEAARQYETPSGVEFPGLALLASGRAPDA